MNLQDKSKRELTNILTDLRVKMENIQSDLKKINRHKSENELLVRRLRKEIQLKEMELDKLKINNKNFEKDEFELENQKKFFKKQIEEIMATQREENKY